MFRSFILQSHIFEVSIMFYINYIWQKKNNKMFVESWHFATWSKPQLSALQKSNFDSLLHRTPRIRASRLHDAFALFRRGKSQGESRNGRICRIWPTRIRLLARPISLSALIADDQRVSINLHQTRTEIQWNVLRIDPSISMFIYHFIYATARVRREI